MFSPERERRGGQFRRRSTGPSPTTAPESLPAGTVGGVPIESLEELGNADFFDAYELDRGGCADAEEPPGTDRRGEPGGRADGGEGRLPVRDVGAVRLRHRGRGARR